MEENRRKRSSKWDLIDDQKNLEDNEHENVRSENYHAPSNEFKSYSGRHSASYAEGDRDVSVRDHASVNRDAWRETSLDRGNRGFSDARTNWDDNGSRRDHDGSPRKSWKRQRRSTSRGRSRSRSRSPNRLHIHESGVNERPRSKLEVPIQTCRDFTSGRCRRGSYCSFLHPSTENYEERRYDFKHREDLIRGGKYTHRNASDGYFNDRTGETFESRRDHDRNTRGESFNHGVERATRRSSDVPCTFFAAGNCRNGKFCHFSHQISLTRNSEGREHDGRWKTNRSPENIYKMEQATKFRDTVDQRSDEYRNEGRWKTNHSSDRVDQINRGKEFIETVDRRVEYGTESRGKDISSQSKSDIHSSSVNSGWANDMERNYLTHSGTTVVDNVVEVKANVSSQWNTDNPGKITTTSEPNAAANWLGDKMSPEWNPKVSSARAFAKEEPAYATQTSESVHHDVPPNSSQLTQYASSVMPDVVETQNFQQNANLINESSSAFSYDRDLGGNIVSNINSSVSDISAKLSSQNVTNGAPGNFNAVGEQQYPPPNHSGNQNVSSFKSSAADYDIYSMKSNYEVPKSSEANTGATSASDMGSQEQLAHLTDLSASLAHLLDKGQQLPQYYASMNPPDMVTSNDVSNGNVSQFRMGIVQPYPPDMSKNPYDPVYGNAGQAQTDSSITITQYPPNLGMLRTTEDVKQEIPSGEPTAHENGYDRGNPNLKPESDTKPAQKSETIHEENKKGKDKNVKTREGSPLDNVEGDDKDGVKKVKDTKVLRDFKYALVNFVKDLLKPAWKDAKIDKEGFKTIVKKATDKVTATIQEANIPQTPEKVEQYLSASKPKLQKLLQAYVDRNQKKQT